MSSVNHFRAFIYQAMNEKTVAAWVFYPDKDSPVEIEMPVDPREAINVRIRCREYFVY